MPSRDEILGLLDRGHSYETAALALGVSPGLVFMIVTGTPADRGGPGAGDGTQVLVNPPPAGPTRNQDVLDWVGRRAVRELGRRG